MKNGIQNEICVALVCGPLENMSMIFLEENLILLWHALFPSGDRIWPRDASLGKIMPHMLLILELFCNDVYFMSKASIFSSRQLVSCYLVAITSSFFSKVGLLLFEMCYHFLVLTHTHWTKIFTEEMK